MSMILNPRLQSPLRGKITSFSGPVLKQDKKLTGRDLPFKDDEPELELLRASYKDFLGEKITYRQLVESCMLWAYHYAFKKGGYMPMDLPVKSVAIMKFESITASELKVINPVTLDRLNREKMEYLTKVGHIRNTNWGYLQMLNKLSNYFKYKEDYDKEQEVNNRIKQFEGVS